MMENITIVQKEQLMDVCYLKTEVLPELLMRKNREYKLNRASILSKIDHIKIRITFKTEQNLLFQVETTNWAVTKEFILLKGGIAIPVQSIVDID